LKNPHIKQHEGKLHVGLYVRIENFGISNKSEKSYEKGDMPVVLKVQSTTSILGIEGSNTEFIPKFFHIDSISEFRKRSHEQWAIAMIAACVIGIRAAYGHFHQFIIVDGYTDSDNDIIALGPHFQKEYNQIVEPFNSGQCVMVLFENIAINPTRDRYLCTDANTIISTVVDTFVQLQLQIIHNKLCTKAQISSREVCISLPSTSFLLVTAASSYYGL
jgi:hypothetical protein